MNAETLTFSAALFAIGCSSKFDKNKCKPNGTIAGAAEEDSGAFNEMPTDDDKSREDDEPEPDPSTETTMPKQPKKSPFLPIPKRPASGESPGLL